MPKRGTTFSLEVGGFKFSFPGSGMHSKPAERATKKPKLKMPMDFWRNCYFLQNSKYSEFIYPMLPILVIGNLFLLKDLEKSLKS